MCAAACSNSNGVRTGASDAAPDHPAAKDSGPLMDGSANDAPKVLDAVDAVDAPSSDSPTHEDGGGTKHDATVDATDSPDADALSDAPTSHDGGVDAHHDSGTHVDAHVDAGVDAGPPALRYIGRTLTDGTDPDGNGNCTAATPCFEWSGTQVMARFTGATAFNLAMSDYGSYFDVYVDGVLQATPVIGVSGQMEYAVATGLSASATHVVSLYKRTEASIIGRTMILGYSFPNGGTLLPPPPAPTRRIEVIGDSISCGYGVLGPNASCTEGTNYEDHDDTYEAITGRSLDAEVYTIASSGRGMYVNIDGTTTCTPSSNTDPCTLPEIYGFTLPYVNPGVTPSAWSFASWVPDVVVINLGTNDFFFFNGDPGEIFETTYLAFVRKVRQNYPGAWIFCTNGPMLTQSGTPATGEYAQAQTYIQSVVSTMADPKVTYLGFATQNQNAANQGCDGHPNPATHQAMATQLTAALTTALGW